MAEYAAFHREVADLIRRDVRFQSTPVQEHARKTLMDADRLLSLAESLEERAAEAENLSGASASMLFAETATGEENWVDAAGIIDRAQTMSRINLDRPNLMVYTVVTIPAVLEQNTSGTVSTRGWQFPINATASTFPFFTVAFASEVQLNEVNCQLWAASAAVATQHTAGWHVKGLGWVPASYRTTHSDSCEPPPCPTAEPKAEQEMDPYGMTYDPFAESASAGAGDCTDGGGGSDEPDSDGTNPDGSTLNPGATGGSGSGSMCPDEAPFYWELGCLETYNEVTGDWEIYWCGAVLVCG